MFPSGNNTAKLNIGIKNDAIFESNETFTIHIEPVHLYNVVEPGMVTVTILDDDEST